MAIMRFRRFTKPQLLRSISRSLLQAFLERFQPAFAAAGLSAPSPALADPAFYESLCAMLLAPEALPSEMCEALFAIDEMATVEGQERLEKVVAGAGIPLRGLDECSREEFALQVWLAAPDVLAAAHNQQRMQRLARFEYFGTKLPSQCRTAFAPPGPDCIGALCSSLDAWFARRHKGREMTAVEMYPIDDEYWFLVQHGDTFVRAATLDGPRQKGVLHFRPERDDVVVYSPEHDEIRINSRTRGERDLYREEFGRALRSDRDYFSQRRTYTLEPLRRAGPGALEPGRVEGICRITLREIEIVADNALNQFTIEGANDLFETSAAHPIPRTGQLTRAQFDFQFADSPKPRPVQIRLPNILKLGRHCDIRAVHRWACQSGFRVGSAAA